MPRRAEKDTKGVPGASYLAGGPVGELCFDTRTSLTEKLSVSIGICAYNEEANIGRLISALQRQGLSRIVIAQMVVVSSACRDRTEAIVESFGKNDPRIELLKQSERRGKASAVNLFLKAARHDVCVLISADTIPQDDTIEQLCLPFFEAQVGMTGGHPVPVDDPATFMGFVSHLIWRLAHDVSLIEPKLGELVAFRRIIDGIPEDTAVDEASIEAMIKKQGYNLRYVPEALVFNKGPGRLSDLIKQRRRIYAGHLHLKKTTAYKASSMSSLRLLRCIMRTLDADWRTISWTPLAMVLEAYCRLLGSYDFHVKRKNPYIWDIASSTKVLGNNRESQELDLVKHHRDP